MNCGFSKTERIAIRNLSKKISGENKEYSLMGKVLLIDELSNKIGRPVFGKQKDNLLEANKYYKYEPEIQITKAEKIYAVKTYKGDDIKALLSENEYIQESIDNGNVSASNGEGRINANLMKISSMHKGAKPKLNISVLDGKKYGTILRDGGYRVFDIETGFVLLDKETNLEPDELLPTIPYEVDQYASSQYADTDKYPLAQRSVQEQIFHNIRSKHPIAKDGTVPIERQMFKSKLKSSIFSTHTKLISSLSELYAKEDKTDYNNAVEVLKSSLPTGIRQIIFDFVDDAEIKRFENKDLPAFSKLMDSLTVPVEKVNGENNWKVAEDGEIVQKKNSKYISPNYLFLLAEEQKHVKNKTENYSELIMPEAYNEMIKFFSVKAMSDMKAMIDDLKNENVDEIRKIFSFDSLEQAIHFKDKLLENNMIPASSFIGDAAKAVFDELGIGVNAKMNMKIKEGLLASINTHIRSTLANSKYVNYVSSDKEIQRAKNKMRTAILATFSVSEYNDLTKDQKVSYNKEASEAFKTIESQFDFGDKNLAFFMFNTDSFEITNNRVDKNGNQLENKYPEYEYQDAFRAINKLQHLSENGRRPLPSMQPSSVQDKMVGSTQNATEDFKEFATKQNSVKWQFKSTMKPFYDEYVKLRDAKDIDSNTAEEQEVAENNFFNFLKANGYVEPDLNKHHIDEIKQLRSVNDKMRRELDIMVMTYANRDFRKDGFFLEWVQPVNGRAMISNDLQPQESKFARSFIEQESDAKSKYEGHSYEMTGSDFKDGSKNMMAMELAIGQGLDMDPDKNSLRTSLINVRNVVDLRGDSIKFGTSDLAKAVEAIATSDKPIHELYEHYAEIFDEGEGFHGLQAMRAIRDLYQWKQGGMKGGFRNELTLETDAITSGMMLTLFQIMDESSIELLAKGGFFTEAMEQKWSDYSKAMLQMKYLFDSDEYLEGKDIHFDPPSLIEAGNFHQQILDALETGKDTMKNIHGKEINIKEWIFNHAPALNLITGDKNSDRSLFADNTGKTADVHKFLREKEVFNDLYKTVGVEMVAEVRMIKKDVNTAVDELENRLNKMGSYGKLGKSEQRTMNSMQVKINELKLVQVMLDSIGEITPAKLRNVAKYPVMYFIYGASIKSIRRNLGNTVGKTSFIKAMKTYKKLNTKDEITGKQEDEKELALAYIQSVLDVYVDKHLYEEKAAFQERNPDADFPVVKYLKFEVINEHGKTVGKSYKEILVMAQENQWKMADVFMRIKLDEKFDKVLLGAVDYTFGSSIEKAFDKKFGSVNKYREMVKTLEIVNFEFFNAKMERRKAELLEKGPIGKEDIDAVLDEIRESGFNHEIVIGDPKSGNAIPMYKADKKSDVDTASFTYTFDESKYTDKDGVVDQKKKNEQDRLYAMLVNMSYASNPRGAPTVSIHKQDSGAIMATISGNSWLSIYDAVVQASNPDNVIASTTDYNNVIFDQNSTREILGDTVNKLVFMLDDIKLRLGSKDSVIAAEANTELETIKNRMYSVREMKKVFSSPTVMDTYSEIHVLKKALVFAPAIFINEDGSIGVKHTEKNKEKTGNEIGGSRGYVNQVETSDKASSNNSIVKRIYWTTLSKKKEIDPESGADISKPRGKNISNTMVVKKFENHAEVTQIVRRKNVNYQDSSVFFIHNGKRINQNYSNLKVEYRINGKENVTKFLNGEAVLDEAGNEINYVDNLVESLWYSPVSARLNGKTIDANGKYTHEGKSYTLSDTDIKLFIDNALPDIVKDPGTRSDGDTTTESYYEVPDVKNGFLTELGSIDLSIFDITRVLQDTEALRTTRHKNLQQKFGVDHMPSALQNPMVHKDGTGVSKRDIDLSSVIDMFNEVMGVELKNQRSHINNLIDDQKEVRPEDYDTLKLAESLAKDTAVELIGGSKETKIAKQMSGMNKRNSGSYNNKSVIAVVFDNENVLNQERRLKYEYQKIDNAIASNATLVLPSFDYQYKTALEHTSPSGLGQALSYSTIRYLLKQKFPDDEYETMKIEIHKIMIYNYLISNSYVNDEKAGNGATMVLKPVKIKYNDEIKNARDLTTYLQDVIMKYQNC